MENIVKYDGITKLTIFLFLICVIVVIMIAGGQLLIPFTWAFLFSFILTPLCDWLERKRFSRSWAALTATLVFCIVSGLILAYLIYQAVMILGNEPVLYEKIKAGFQRLLQSAKDNLGVSIVVPTIDPVAGTNFRQLLGFFARQISGIGENLVTMTLIPMYLFFTLNYRGLAHRFVVHRFEGTSLQSAEDFVQRSQASIQNYLLGTLVLTGVSAAMSFVILLLFGVSYPFFFGIFIAVLNLIPYAGNLVAFGVILIFTWATKDSGYIVLFTGISLYASNMIQENFLRPKLIGDKMEMNAMMVFTAVVVGGMIWGFSGMVLFIPLLGILQSLLNSNPKWRPYTIFFEAGDKKD